MPVANVAMFMVFLSRNFLRLEEIFRNGENSTEEQAQYILAIHERPSIFKICPRFVAENLVLSISKANQSYKALLSIQQIRSKLHSTSGSLKKSQITLLDNRPTEALDVLNTLQEWIQNSNPNQRRIRSRYIRFKGSWKRLEFYIKMFWHRHFPRQEEGFFK